MISLILVVLVIIGFIGCGGFMIYSAITGKGIEKVPKDMPYLYFQYVLRGIIGVVSVIMGILFLLNILK